MEQHKYLVVGGGMAGHAAVQGIRELEPDAVVGIIGAEPHPPYNRPPLSKALWRDKKEETIWRKMEGGTRLHLGRRAVSLDPHAHRLVDDQGNEHAYDKLLLALGGTPRRFPFGGDEVTYYRTLDDFHKLHALARDKRRFAVIGSGFIGSEIAAALAMNGREVVMIYPEQGPAARLFPAELTDFLAGYYREKGVQLREGRLVKRIERRKEGVAVGLSAAGGTAEELLVDAVVAGLGIEPNVELARAAGLPVDNGIVVDEELRAGHADVYAAGDVANFHNPQLNKRVRVEHEDNALKMGKQAGRNMAGAAEPYRHLPFFYSDLFDLGYEAVGELDSRLETMVDWSEPFRKGVVYYLAGGRVRGVLLWNVWGQLDAARALIAEAGPFQPEALKGRIPAA